jgi:hypothetical protein
VKQTSNKTKKTEILSVHNYSPPKSQYFVEPPFVAISTASLYKLGTTSHWDSSILGKTAPAPSSWMNSAGVQHSLSHTTDSQLD